MTCINMENWRDLDGQKDIKVIKRLAREEFAREITIWLSKINPIFLCPNGQKISQKYNKLRLSSAKTRWGSCSSSGAISLNWKLYLVPEKIMQYVIVHEIIHFAEPNHSANFWQKVEYFFPDYKQCRAWLKANGLEIYQKSLSLSQDKDSRSRNKSGMTLKIGMKKHKSWLGF